MIDYERYERAQGLNWYAVDPDLRFLTDYHLDAADRDWAETHLQRMGALCGGPIAERSETVDKNPPRVERYDRWGEEINEVVHHPASLATKRDLWEHGFLGLPCSREVKERGRPVPPVLLQAFQYLLCQADTGMLCSVGMTVAAAELIERYAAPDVRERFLSRMTTMNYDEAMDGSMFMTEKLGGSDLGTATMTTAHRTADGWRVDGEKWFCSNVDGEVIMLLARPEGAPAGVCGLALFLLPKRRRDGSRNGIHIRRLKDKLGTRSVPTGEVELRDAEAYLLAGSSNVPDGRGLNRMMEMVNTSRIGVAIMGLGILRRSFLESAIYTARRQAFGKRLRDQPMVREQLVHMLVDLEAAAAMVFAAGAGARSQSARRFTRILVPLAKFRVTRRGLEAASLAVELHGGNGYIENWPVARQLRDAQCHTIWEGAENVICLDVLRAMMKEQAHEALFDRVEAALRQSRDEGLAAPSTAVRSALAEVREVIAALAGMEPDRVQLNARAVTGYLADVTQGALLLEQAAWELAQRGSARKAVIAEIFADRYLTVHPLRGILSGNRAALDLFDELVCYGDIAPERAARYLCAPAARAVA
ncbi:MAG: acyl-CoA dehydrogenase family protein [Candidatus Binatia bacterium]|jgi:acyl-CoA dehydrogenase